MEKQEILNNLLRLTQKLNNCRKLLHEDELIKEEEVTALQEAITILQNEL